jgi:hypothetical protein
MAGSFIDRLGSAGLVAACVDAEAVPHSFMSPARVVPENWMALIERADGRRRFVPAGQEPRPERDEFVLFVRQGQIAVPFAAEGAAADKHDVTVSGELLVHWQARDDELASLRRTLLDSGASRPAGR